MKSRLTLLILASVFSTSAMAQEASWQPAGAPASRIQAASLKAKASLTNNKLTVSTPLGKNRLLQIVMPAGLDANAASRQARVFVIEPGDSPPFVEARGFPRQIQFTHLPTGRVEGGFRIQYRGTLTSGKQRAQLSFTLPVTTSGPPRYINNGRAR